MSSVSANDGSATITITFKVGLSVDIAAVDVQNRVAQAQGQLPRSSNQAGITVSRKTPAPARRDAVFAGRFYRSRGHQQLRVSAGGGSAQAAARRRDVTIFGERRYSMRIWLDPDKLAELGITTDGCAERELPSRISRRRQVSSDSSPAPPGTEFRVPGERAGRLSDPGAVRNIVIRAGTGSEAVVRLRNVGRIELGA